MQAEGYQNAAYIEIPFDIYEVFGKKWIKVKATFDKVVYRGLVLNMGGTTHILGLLFK